MVIAAFVVLAGLLGMLTAILTSLNERRREMAILARPRHVFGLLVAAALLMGLLPAWRLPQRVDRWPHTEGVS